jgi:hypothetical protein
MIGFAVTSFFVSFAWMDPVYFMAALITGLYVAAQAQLAAGESGGSGLPSHLAVPRSVSGWRVRQSAWRSSLLAAARTK